MNDAVVIRQGASKMLRVKIKIKRGKERKKCNMKRRKEKSNVT